MTRDKEIQVGIGFATGRKHFKKILRTCIYNWQECGLVERQNVRLNVFIRYDLKYNKTKETDYTDISRSLTDMVDNIYFIDEQYIQDEIQYLVEEQAAAETDITFFFGAGYAAMRNSILYAAIKKNMDYLVFMDDDEYPLAVTKNPDTTLWSGQHVLKQHLQYIKNADITNGYHCGYISPIPCIDFNDVLTENDFRMFIEAISNDIINWESLKKTMRNGGITYADRKIFTDNIPQEVIETDNTKFISGANLCINLKNPKRTFPFYNPPNARGEDTFLSTCLKDRTVLRIPCYAFHDGFSMYKHLLSGVLPTKLERIEIDSKKVINRFYKACIGWIRYKPLFLYITQRDTYDEKIDDMRKSFQITLPKLCDYFGLRDFMKIASELEKYHKQVKLHYQQYLDNQIIWSNICDHIVKQTVC